MTLFGKKLTAEEQVQKDLEEAYREMEAEKEREKSMPPITTTSPPVKDGVTFDDICREIMFVHKSKDDQYASSPLDELSISAWKYQIQIKATRALRSKTPEKLKDGTYRYCVYCICY